MGFYQNLLKIQSLLKVEYKDSQPYKIDTKRLFLKIFPYIYITRLHFKR